MAFIKFHMKRKTVILIGALALTLAGCSGEVAVDSTTETSEIVECTEQISETERTIYSYNTLDHIDVESEESLKASIIREVSNEQEEERFLADYRKAHQIEGDGEELSQNGYSKVICYEKSAEGAGSFGFLSI